MNLKSANLKHRMVGRIGLFEIGHLGMLRIAVVRGRDQMFDPVLIPFPAFGSNLDPESDGEVPVGSGSGSSHWPLLIHVSSTARRLRSTCV
jgi:hypothetical protein